MSPEALSELIFNIANNLVNEGKAGTLTTDLIPPQAKFAVMRPKDRAHGDWASNAAMQLAKKAGMKPHDFAELFAAELANADGIKSVEVAGPGFINIVLDSASAAAVVDTVLNEGANYGKNDHLSGKTLNLEFVSANPTGPIHIGGTRWAAVGDSMARVLEANGAKVVREYYFNDHGEQINRFAKSLVAAAHGEETPIDGYKGAYIDEIARRVIDEAKADGIAILDLPRVDGGVDNDGNPLGEGDSEQREEFRKRAVPMMFDEIRKSMKDFRVNFDVWFHENSLYSDGEVDKAIADLRERGDIYEKDGATWFESTKHGDDKDRVIIKSDGNYAYFAADIAYYRNKRHRDNDPADIAIYMLGADHHGYIGRMMAMCAAFGDEPGENMQILIGQLVNVLKDGKAVRMSKARSSWILWSSALVIVNSSFPIRHASSPLSRSLGASESRDTRSAIRDASPRIGHLPFLKVSITSCRCPVRRSSGRSSSTARHRFPACYPGSCRPVPLPARRPHPSGSPEPAAAGIRWNAGRWR